MTGNGEIIGVRIRPSQLSALDSWIADQSRRTSRPEAIRRLVEAALANTAERRPASRTTARKASELAAREIEGMGDKSQPFAERQRRMRRLIRGPTEFRNIRNNQRRTKS
jgi:Arc/MetJ-type ribon-helix-helix transcriptional regulator